MTQPNAVIQQKDAEKLLEELVLAMDAVLEKMKPELKEIEEKLLKGMVFYGASEHDVAKVRLWLRPMMEQEVKRLIYNKVTESL